MRSSEEGKQRACGDGVNGGDASLVAFGLKIFFGLLFGVPVATVAITFVVGISTSALTWSEMDLNDDGHTSIAELIESGDVGVLSTSQDGKSCTEFFGVKDGVTFRVRCH